MYKKWPKFVIKKLHQFGYNSFGITVFG